MNAKEGNIESIAGKRRFLSLGQIEFRSAAATPGDRNQLAQCRCN